MNEQLNEQQFNRQIGKKIIFFREKEKLTQNELAKLAGIGRVSLNYYEQGKRKLPLEVAYRLSNILNFELGELVDLEKNNKHYTLNEDIPQLVTREKEDTYNILPKNKENNTSLSELSNENITTLFNKLSELNQLKVRYYMEILLNNQ